MAVKSNFEEFERKASTLHNNRYKYFHVYENSQSKVPIECPKHGIFYMNPNTHLNGSGCPECGKAKCHVSKVLTNDEFLQRASKRHNDTYEYLTPYTGMWNYIEIRCKTHGVFRQFAHSHLKGCGCPKCSRSHLESKVESFLKEHNINFITQHRFTELGYQTVDFFIPECNTVIECQGRQHFMPVEKFGGIKEYEKTVIRDKKKFEICSSLGLAVIYIVSKKEVSAITEFYDGKTVIADNNMDKMLELIHS